MLPEEVLKEVENTVTEAIEAVATIDGSVVEQEVLDIINSNEITQEVEALIADLEAAGVPSAIVGEIIEKTDAEITVK